MLRRALSLLLFSLLVWAPGCSGGGKVAHVTQPGCTQGGSGQTGLCLTTCNLGCTAAGCAINQIAQNQPVILSFNKDIDPGSVSSASVSLRTSTGEEPVGRLLVNGSVVQFVPEVLVVGAQSFFGFRAGETYQMVLPGGAQEINAVRSASGDPFAETYACTLVVSRGIEDLDGQPPRATLVSPSLPYNVNPATTVVLEFSELISQAPFVTATPTTQPVDVRVRLIRQGATGPECDPSSVPQPIFGAWQLTNDPVRQVTRATFTPNQEVPSGVCIEVEVTSRVEDLSGKPAQGQTFQYFTQPGVRPPEALVDEFDNSLNMDVDVSSGAWTNGFATPGELGRDGLHGEFDPALGVLVGPNTYEWSTDDITIPRSYTLSGLDERITDGVFRFARFMVPLGVTVRFVGTKPARLYVRGRARIDGVVDLAGGSLTTWDGLLPTGQPGAAGGAAAASGGAGADRGDGLGNQPAFNGRDGADVRLPAGHAYAGQAAGTGGKGSRQWPADGLDSSITYGLISPGLYSTQVVPGGGGGGFGAAGSNGTVLQTHFGTAAEGGPDAPGGKRLNLLPIPAGRGVLDHLLVGGSGGGGSASHPFLVAQSFPYHWRSGAGGAGGGGALGLRTGSDLSIASTAQVLTPGGSTQDSDHVNNYAIPGGGGSGGSVVLQVGGIINQGGLVDVGAGRGGTQTGLAGFVNMSSKGGDGAPGYLRLEMPGTPDPTKLGSTRPPFDPLNPQNTPSITVAALTERDAIVGAQSLWMATRQVFPPLFLRYELDAVVDSNAVKFSDDPTLGPLAAGSTAVQFFVQGALLDASGAVDPGTIRPWRKYVGPFAPAGEVALTDDRAQVVRFVLLFDRSVAQSIRVDRVQIFFQPF